MHPALSRPCPAHRAAEHDPRRLAIGVELEAHGRALGERLGELQPAAGQADVHDVAGETETTRAVLDLDLQEQRAARPPPILIAGASLGPAALGPANEA